MAQHTPGPWHVDDVNTPNGQTYEVNHFRSDGDCVNIADVCEFTDGQDCANAHLIAAAPDLLAACEEAVDDLDGDPNRVELRQTLAAAIAKARGTTTGA